MDTEEPRSRTSESDAPTPEARALAYAARVTSHPLGIYAMVAEGTASSTFEGHATVADLWASLSGWPTPISLFGDRPRCLTLEPVTTVDETRSMFEQMLVPTHARFYARTANRAASTSFRRIPDDGRRPAGWRANRADGDGTGAGSHYRFVREDGSVRPLSEVGEAGPDSGLSRRYVVRPRVGGAAVGPPSEFLTLWALLFCLSELARYYPDVWSVALILSLARRSHP